MFFPIITSALLAQQSIFTEPIELIDITTRLQHKTIIHIWYKHVLLYLEKHVAITPFQWAGLNGHSTITWR